MSNELTIGDLQTIELILIEASAWGLRYEVEETAKKLIEEGSDILVAYEDAYADWVK